MFVRFRRLTRRLLSGRHSLLTRLLAGAAVACFAQGAAAAATITGATNASPIVVTSAAHGLVTGSQVTITGVTGNTAANGIWTVTVVDANRFSLNASTGSGSYSGGGMWTEAEGALTSLVVTKTADTDDDVCDADCSLREALFIASQDPGPETITFVIPTSDPAYNPAIQRYTITLTGRQLVVPGGRVTIRGLGANRLAISGNRQSRVFYIGPGADVTLDRLSILDGLATDCPSAGSFFGCGGGIANVGGTVNVSNSYIADNNGGSYGGAVSNLSGATLNVINTTFLRNTATDYGGGIYNDRSTLNVVNSTFSLNGSLYGAGISNHDLATLNVSSSTFSGNSASAGGSVLNSGSQLNLRNTIFTNSSGGQCYFGDTGNVTGSNNLIDDETCGTDPAFRVGVVTNFDTVPRSNGATMPTHALFGGNAVNAVPAGQCTAASSGTNPLFANGATIATDQRGVTRPQGAACDIGAFEVVINQAPTATEDSYTATVNTPLTVAAPGVLANDRDADGDSLNAFDVSGPSHGTLLLDPSGAFTYTPESGFTGTDTFTYRASDGKVSTSAVRHHHGYVPELRDHPDAGHARAAVCGDPVPAGVGHQRERLVHIQRHGGHLAARAAAGVRLWPDRARRDSADPRHLHLHGHRRQIGLDVPAVAHLHGDDPQGRRAAADVRAEGE